MRKFVLPIGVLGLAALSLVGLGGAANAGSTSLITKNTTSYQVPSNQSPKVQSLAQGTHVQAHCFAEGQDLHGNYYWFRVTKDGGQPGFVHRDAIIGLPGNLPHC